MALNKKRPEKVRLKKRVLLGRFRLFLASRRQEDSCFEGFDVIS